MSGVIVMTIDQLIVGPVIRKEGESSRPTELVFYIYRKDSHYAN